MACRRSGVRAPLAPLHETPAFAGVSSCERSAGSRAFAPLGSNLEAGSFPDGGVPSRRRGSVRTNELSRSSCPAGIPARTHQFGRGSVSAVRVSLPNHAPGRSTSVRGRLRGWDETAKHALPLSARRLIRRARPRVGQPAAHPAGRRRRPGPERPGRPALRLQRGHDDDHADQRRAHLLPASDRPGRQRPASVRDRPGHRRGPRRPAGPRRRRSTSRPSRPSASARRSTPSTPCRAWCATRTARCRCSPVAAARC
jgi:hypothetical protein